MSARWLICFKTTICYPLAHRSFRNVKQIANFFDPVKPSVIQICVCSVHSISLLKCTGNKRQHQPRFRDHQRIKMVLQSDSTTIQPNASRLQVLSSNDSHHRVIVAKKPPQQRNVLRRPSYVATLFRSVSVRWSYIQSNLARTFVQRISSLRIRLRNSRLSEACLLLNAMAKPTVIVRECRLLREHHPA